MSQVQHAENREAMIGGYCRGSRSLVDALHGDYTQVRRALTELLHLLVDLRLIPALCGCEVFKLKYGQAGRLPVALKDDEFTAANENLTAACCDRSRRCGLVLLPTLWVGDVGFGDDICRHGGTLRLRL
jgi:hypothetical protein